MDLELVPTDELVEELMRRFDNVIVVANKDMTEKESGQSMYWKCKTLHEGIGLLEVLKHRLIHRLEKNSKNTDSL